MIDIDQFLTDYMTRGFYCFNAAPLLSGIEIDRFEAVTVKHEDNCFHAEGHEFHNEYMAAEIEQLRLSLTRLFVEWSATLQFDFYSEAVNEQVQLWHNDAQYAQPDQNATINCFFDRCAPDIGGAFEMSEYKSVLLGTKNEDPHSSIWYPQQYDVLVFNQNRNFLHKARPSTQKRRLISFATTFANINPLLPNWH